MNKSKKIVITFLITIIAILGVNFSINKINQKNLVYEEYIRRYIRIQSAIEQLIISLEKEVSKSQLDSKNIVRYIGRAESSITAHSTHLPETVDQKTSSIRDLLDKEIQPTFSWLRDEIRIKKEKTYIDLGYINNIIDLLKQLNGEMSTEDREFDLIFTDERRKKINRILKEIANIASA